MSGEAADGGETLPSGAGPRATVRFYLLDHRTAIGMAIDVALLSLNLVFVAIYVAETYALSARVDGWLWAGEVGIACVFLVEYVLRLYGARDRVAEAADPYTVADLLAILPTFVLLLAPGAVVFLNVGFLRALRVIRVLRFYRFTRDAEFFFGTVSDNALRALKLLMSVLVVLFVASGLFYAAEVDVNAEIEAFGDAFYYMVVTLSTTGFGDILPETAAGRWVTVGSIIGAIIVIPWYGSKIVREWARADKKDVTCPNCGLTGHDPDASHCKACGHIIYQEYEGDA